MSLEASLIDPAGDHSKRMEWSSSVAPSLKRNGRCQSKADTTFVSSVSAVKVSWTGLTVYITP